MNPRGQVAPQALLENVFENQELGEGGGSVLGPDLMANPVRDPHFWRVQIPSAALKGLRKGLKIGCKKVGDNWRQHHQHTFLECFGPRPGTAYSALQVQDGLKKCLPRVALLVTFRARCLIKRLRLAFQTRSQAAPAAQ